MEDRLLMKIAEAGPLEVSSLLQVCGDYLSQSKPQARLHWIINDDLEQVSAGPLVAFDADITTSWATGSCKLRLCYRPCLLKTKTSDFLCQALPKRAAMKRPGKPRTHRNANP